VFDPIVLDARNPGPMTGAGNNTYFLVSRKAAALIDAGVGHPAHLAALDRVLRERDATLAVVAVTHGHADHMSGARDIAAGHPSAVFAKWPTPEMSDAIRWRALQDGDVLSVGDECLTAVHTPGHTPDHLAFWHEPTRALFTGDLVGPGGSVVIDVTRGGDLGQYLRSLARLLELEPNRLFPAHGRPGVDDPVTVVRAHVEHRLMRERQVIGALGAGHRTVEAIAESIYHGLDVRLMAAARENVRAHLQKLRADAVAADEDGWRLLA
jgi:glyoxylase-like metal-dependent hydrolase (beta-lactamase superfamily II)